ncbi:MAG: hypothetical protein P1S60_12195 [Anaerolineae bacterium]|nr:hypothetical protein [Anaerolineae bacterium]
MKTYLQANTLPTVKIGNVELPRLIMGIHPYDGCSYVDQMRDANNLKHFDRVQKVSPVIRYAVEQEGLSVVQCDHMIPNLNRLHLQAIWETERQIDTHIGLIAYILVPISLDGIDITYSERAHATLYQHDMRIGGAGFEEHIHSDEIIRYILGGSFDKLVTPETVPPFTDAEISRLEIDYQKLEQYLGFFAGLDILVADPGAEIDLLAMTGRFDLIREYLHFLRQRYANVITSVHHAGVTIPLLEKENIPVDAYLTPVNAMGLHMFPTRETAVVAIQEASRPVIAIKPLAGGRYLGQRAFAYVFNIVGAAATMFGMGTLSQVKETTRWAKDVLDIK